MRDLAETDESFSLDESVGKEWKEQVKIFMLNVRETVGILLNVFLNQIRILVNQRVVYSREEFNYESYMSVAMHDNRLLRSVLFCKSGRHLLSEYFKF